jgi:uncharacterized protein YbaP (TraB family)
MRGVALCLALGLLSPSAFAGKKDSHRSATAVDPAEGQPVNLWRVEKAGQPPSYLFGTCHHSVDLRQALPAEHEPLLRQADQLVTEIALGEMFQPKIVAMFLLPEGQSLRVLVGDDTWAQLTQQVGAEAATNLERLHPAIATMGLAQQFIQPEIDGTPSLGVMDVSIASLAQRSGVPIRQLETPEEQVHAMLGGELSTHVDGVRAILDPAARAQLTAQTNAMLDACRTGAHGPAIQAIQAVPAAWRATMFDARNEAWVPKLEAHFAEGATFAAVGLGHLIGDGSVVERLASRGYTVTRLSGVVAAGRDPHAPVTLDEWLTMMRDQLPTMFCGAGLIGDCLDVPLATCRDVFTASVNACASKLPLPDPVPMAKGAQLGAGIGQCTTESALHELRARLRETPACAQLVGP